MNTELPFYTVALNFSLPQKIARLTCDTVAVLSGTYRQDLADDRRTYVFLCDLVVT